MIKLKFKCELLTDVILNEKSASEGSNRTLDFIPGSNFLGIVASKLYHDDSIDMSVKRRLFHSKDVRFGDAHPANGDNRTLRMPACLYFPKGAEEKDRIHYVHHAIQDTTTEELRNIQLKQERGGFADFIATTAIRLKVKSDYAIKSAYDRDFRRSKDEQMFGYQSMGKGLTYYFSIDLDDGLEGYKDRITESLTKGNVRIGRSKSAQYGQVIISTDVDFKSPESAKDIVKAGGSLVIYAESRLIFLDDDNQPTFQPSGELLTGNEKDKILWAKSQIRTFQYAPYNYQRRCFDTDRCGIEKGSVIVVQVANDTDISKLSCYLGSYQNEGFGKVIYNPYFLKADEKGVLTYKIVSPQDADKEKIVVAPSSDLITYVKNRAGAITYYDIVNKWVEDHIASYKKANESFASQWGNIRNLAYQSETSEILFDKLFCGEDDKEMEEKDKGYLVHGTSKERWKDKIASVKDFVNKYPPEAVANLAGEMQKRCK